MAKQTVCILFLGLWGRFALGALPEGRELTNSAGIRLVRVEPGAFVMGSGQSPPRSKDEWLLRDWDESPAHRVRISTSATALGCSARPTAWASCPRTPTGARGSGWSAAG